MRALTLADCTITLTHEVDDLPIEGNAMASSDDQADRETEQWIRDQLDAGNAWAWAAVTVTVAWEGFEASDYLGGCSYKSEEDFREPGGYFDDMCAAALEALNEKVSQGRTAMERL